MKKLAEYFGVSLSAAYKWSAETIRRKTIIMESGAEPEIIKLIGEISSLCYILDCKYIVADIMTLHAAIRVNAESVSVTVINFAGTEIYCPPLIMLDGTPTAVAELQKVKQTLESFIY
jgi:hypothetical protein